MITKEEAEKIVLAHFTKRLAVNFELETQSDKTFEFEEGYVIWFNGKKENIVGVFPAIVEKKTGGIIYLKMHGKAQEMIELYRSNKL